MLNRNLSWPPIWALIISPSYYGTHCTNRLDRPWDVCHVYSAATKEAVPWNLVGQSVGGRAYASSVRRETEKEIKEREDQIHVRTLEGSTTKPTRLGQLPTRCGPPSINRNHVFGQRSFKNFCREEFQIVHIPNYVIEQENFKSLPNFSLITY